MKIRPELALVYLAGFIFIEPSLCDEGSGKFASSNWTCTCLSSSNKSAILKSGCASSCHCTAAADLNGDEWTCTCPGDSLPKVASDSNSTTCFKACNCTAGFHTERQPSRKHARIKTVLVILLLCVTLTTLALIASVICHIRRKFKDTAEKTPSLSEGSSWNSTSNLISLKTSVSQSKFNNRSLIKGCCFKKASILLGTKTETIHGTIIQFSYAELEFATGNFSSSNLIGVGGSSSVYRGQLKDGTMVAIKRLTTREGPDSDSIFSTEVELLSRLHHFHVVPLLGYCFQFRGKHTERLLVFEYMPHGNLRDCLDGDSVEMTWNMRVVVALGAARGLEYLHEAAAPRILHRDVKSTNILLDKNWNAKITDLGMAKCLVVDGRPSCPSSPARMQGTFGYFAPEYAIAGRASPMSDVFSFGVVLLELITGRKPIRRSNKGEESLVIWATPRLQDSKRVIAELPDPRLNGNFPEEEMQIMAYLAKECLLLDPDARPTMSEAVQILSSIAPDKSRRRIIPINLFQKKGERWIEKPAIRPDEAAKDSQEMKQTKPLRSALLWLPMPSDDTPGADGVSSRLIPMASRSGRSNHAQDEVDLTEPRYESFRVGSIRSQTQSA